METEPVFDAVIGGCYYRARYYDQNLGRFFSRDPLFLLQSLYIYCNNSPENLADPFAMQSLGKTPSVSKGVPWGMVAPWLIWWPPSLPPGAPSAGFWRNLWNTLCGRGRDASKDKEGGGYKAKHRSTNSDGSENYDIYCNGRKAGESRVWPGTGSWASWGDGEGSFHVTVFGGRVEVEWFADGAHFGEEQENPFDSDFDIGKADWDEFWGHGYGLGYRSAIADKYGFYSDFAFWLACGFGIGSAMRQMSGATILSLYFAGLSLGFDKLHDRLRIDHEWPSF